MHAPGTVFGWHNFGRHAQWLVLALSLSFTYLFWLDAHHVSVQKQRADFDELVADVANRILQRVVYDEQILHGVRAFYLNKHRMERSDFEGYIAALELEKNYPGIQGVSFAPLLSGADKSSFLESQRKSGLPDFAIKPDMTRERYAPVAYIAPFNASNARVLGFDNLSDPIRTATIELARDQDRAIISEKLALKQDADQAAQPGFLMFMPVYRRGVAHDTLAARRENIDGWFAAAFRMSDLMAGVLDGLANNVGIAVFDGNEISAQNRMYLEPDRSGYRNSSLFVATMRIKVSGHIWSMQVFSLPEFEAKHDKSEEFEVLAWGGALSLLLSLFTWLLMRHLKRINDMASVIGREFDMRREAENTSRDLSRFNEVIFEKSPAGIAVYKFSGLCVMVNAAYAKAIGGTVDVLLQQNFRGSESWRRNGLLDLANQALDTGSTIRRDIEGVTSFGRAVVLECILSRIDIFGESHLLVITSDISDRVKAERSLNDSMRKLENKELAKNRFLAAAGHDLRQPLTAANMYVYALKSTVLTTRQHELIQRMDFSLSTLSGLLDSLLNVSKLDAGKIKPEYAAINVAELIIWLEQNFAPMAKDKQLGFRLYFPLNKRLFVKSDVGLLKSVLMNLVSNAIKFTSSGAILVSARQRGNEVLFQVWDTGIGISGEYMEHIFDEFYQVENPQRDRGHGLGLGLSIVKRTLALLGSEIGCRSQPGKGSVFEFRLALDGALSERAQAGKALVGSLDENLSVAGKTFVVVEDDLLVAQAISACLEELGGTVTVCNDALEALHQAETVRVDYYVVDYMLGGALNGIEFLNRLRQQSVRPIFAVLMTGDTSSNFIRESMELDWPVLYKPLDVSELLDKLRAQEAAVRAD